MISKPRTWLQVDRGIQSCHPPAPMLWIQFHAPTGANETSERPLQNSRNHRHHYFRSHYYLRLFSASKPPSFFHRNPAVALAHNT